MRRMVMASSLLAVALLGGCATDSPEVNGGDRARGENAGRGNGGGNSGGGDEEEGGGIAAFGDQVTFGSGLSVQVSQPAPYTKSGTAAGGERAKSAVSFTVTVVNDGNKPYDPTEFSQTVQSGNGEADEIYDSEKGLNGSPMTVVLPGREVKWQVGYGVNNPDDLVMQVSPTFDFTTEPAIFQTQ